MKKCNGCSAVMFGGTYPESDVTQYKCRELPVKARGGDYQILTVRRIRNRPDLTYIKRPGHCPRNG